MAKPTSFQSAMESILARASAQIAGILWKELARAPATAKEKLPTAAPRSKPAATTPAAVKPAKKRRQLSGATGTALDMVFAVIRSNPDLRSEQIRAHVSLSPPEVTAALAQLRVTGLVKTTGATRATTYSVAGAAAREGKKATAPKAKPVPSAKVKAKSAPAASTPAPNAAAPKRKAPARFQRRAPAQVTADNNKLLAFIKAHPGLRSEELQKGMGFPKSIVAAGLQALRDAGTITMNGIKRAATYTAV